MSAVDYSNYSLPFRHLSGRMTGTTIMSASPWIVGIRIKMQDRRIIPRNSRMTATFHQQVTEHIHTNDTVRRSVDGCLACILGREASARNIELTMDQLIKENRKLEPNLKGLRS